VDFEAHVRRALESLPPELARVLDNVAVVVEEENRDDPGLLGLYEGVPLTERGDWAGELPDRIAIYRRPLVAEFGDDPAELEHEIRVTVLHELAHHVGIDEDRLTELGYE
jgi:predicted Zn-dependent protease with MMP-like domain